MIDFATLQGVAIPEGVVTQIESGGVVLWRVAEASGPVVLEVEKITSDTYAGETTYTGEQFILLDVYPKTNGTVSVTYGGLTKTITDTSGAAEPNAQRVFFGTFNGVSDSVETPASGILTIEGDYAGFGAGYFTYTSKMSGYSPCITAVVEWGETDSVKPNAFYKCEKMALDALPEAIRTVGKYAFFNCPGVRFSDSFFAEGITSIGTSSFSLDTYEGETDEETKAKHYTMNVTIPSTVSYIGDKAFATPVVGANSYSFFKRITVLAETPPTTDEKEIVQQTMFSSVSSAGSGFSIVVPKGCGEAYKAADGWNAYADYIVEAS